MDSVNLTFQTQKSARISTLGDWNAQTRHVWMVLHAYGQLAPYFIKNFEALNLEDTFVLAPEGLSRFYLDAQFERVGASWMTKEERLQDIDDNMAYLTQVWNSFSTNRDLTKIKFHLLGFSQGTATAWRWLRHTPFAPASLIIWAGTVPLDYSSEMAQLLQNKTIISAYGSKDPYLEHLQKEDKLDSLKAIAPHVQIITFNDAHRIPSETLLDVENRVR